MSKKLFFIRQALSCAFLLSLMGAIACDRCYDLATQLCSCEETEEARKACKANLGLAKSHKFFEIARDQNICERALEDCSCKKMKEGQDEKCGLYRNALKGG